MIRKCNKFIYMTLCLLIIGSISVPIMASSVSDVKSEKSSLEKKKEATEARIAELEKGKDDILTYIEKLDKELSDLSDRIDELTKKEKLGKEELVVTKQKLEEAEGTVADQYETMKKRICYMYENGSTEYIEIIFSAGSVSDLLNRAEYVSKITEYDDNMLEKYKQAKQEVKDQKAALEAKIKEIKEVQEETKYEKETVQKLANKKTEELKKYKKNIANSENLVESYENKIQQKEDEIENLLAAERKRVEAEERQQALRRQQEKEQAAAVGSRSAYTEEADSEARVSSGGYRWPLPGYGRISSGYGGRNSPTAGASSNHKGIDIPAPTGTSILAAKSGTVVTASYSVSAGNYVMISHGGGVYTVYMHSSKLLVSAGQSVSQGQTIALVGSTGYSTGAHLHFGVSVNGSYQNPLNYVSP